MTSRDEDYVRRANEQVVSKLLHSGTSEAIQWLGEVDSGRTIGEGLTRAEAMEIIEGAYSAGAITVLVAEVDSSTMNSGSLLIELPDSEHSKRVDVFLWEAKMARQAGFNPVHDFGQTYIFVKLD